MNNIIIVQARLNSKRLPSKVFLKIGNKRIVDGKGLDRVTKIIKK